MKYLNKIIFINSANIPYAEIAVDGNVHFTGTQGVGKSTVLRALLFFIMLINIVWVFNRGSNRLMSSIFASLTLISFMK